MSTIVWYNVLCYIYRVSKIFQSSIVSIETVSKDIIAESEYLEEFQDHGFDSAKTLPE